MAKSFSTVNIWVARFVPLILIGIICYSAYVITKVVAIDYLINPPSELPVRPRPGSAIAILVVYFLLFVVLLLSYFRLLLKIATHPGYVPRSAAWYAQRRQKDVEKKSAGRGSHGKRTSGSEKVEKSQATTSWLVGSHGPESGGSKHSSRISTSKDHASQQKFGTDSQTADIPFWQRDMFVCKFDGRPPFCTSCLSYKTDRTHHCSEVDRCVLKMDHFCPWVGGIISETSFKFFIQFLVYAALFCITVLTTVAYFISERRRNEGTGFLNIHYFLLLGISALFLLFTLGMALSSTELGLRNSSTVENLNRKNKISYLALLLPQNPDGTLPVPTSSVNGAHGPLYHMITYPRPAEEEQFLIKQAKQEVRNHKPQNPPPPGTSTTTTTTTNPTSTTTNTPPPSSTINQQPLRTFAILATKEGENPYDIGPWNNIRQVMGTSIWQWLLPIKASPCADHRSRVSSFPLNEALLARLRKEAGFPAGIGGGGDDSSSFQRHVVRGNEVDGTVEREGGRDRDRDRDRRHQRRKRRRSSRR